MEIATSENAPLVSIRPESALRDCDEAKARAVLMDFAAAYSSMTGDPMKFIADESAFQWLSDDLRNSLRLPNGFHGDSMLDPRNRGTLGAYLSWRRQVQPSMTIDLFQLNDVTGSKANFQLELTWGGVRYGGKGAINCTQMKIIVFSIGLGSLSG